MEVETHRDDTTHDCGWVDYVQWSGVLDNPLPTDWTTITYTYDPAGRRIAKSYDGTVVARYLYDGPQTIAEYDGNNRLLRKYVHGPAVDQPICMIDANETCYYHYDGLGSVVGLSDAAGEAAVLYEYGIYGQVAASDPNHPNPFLFTGREFDKETGLYYYRARYYNPYIGRFLQTDPAGDGMNTYAYCRNSPVKAVDPSGTYMMIDMPPVSASSLAEAGAFARMMATYRAIKHLVDDPVVVIGMQRGGNVVVHAYQISSRDDLYYILFWYNVFDDNGSTPRSVYDQIVYLDIHGHGYSNAKGHLKIGSGDNEEEMTGRLGEDTSFDTTALLAREHYFFMTKIGYSPKVFSFENLVKGTFAYNAVIRCDFCYSAAGGHESVAYAFKELLPGATVYGWTGMMWGLPTNEDWTEWIAGPSPWPPWPWNSKCVEMPLQP